MKRELFIAASGLLFAATALVFMGCSTQTAPPAAAQPAPQPTVIVAPAPAPAQPSSQGPAGPTGAQGPTGSQGPTGATGSPTPQ